MNRLRNPNLYVGVALATGMALGMTACGSGDRTVEQVDGVVISKSHDSEKVVLGECTTTSGDGNYENSAKLSTWKNAKMSVVKEMAANDSAACTVTLEAGKPGDVATSCNDKNVDLGLLKKLAVGDMVMQTFTYSGSGDNQVEYGCTYTIGNHIK